MNSTLVEHYMPLTIASDGDDIDQTEKGILLALAYHANVHDGWCYPSQQTIADFARLSIRSVQRGINKLIARGVLQQKRSRNEAGQFEYTEYRICGSEAILKERQERRRDERAQAKEEQKTPPEPEAEAPEQPGDNLAGGPHDSQATATRQPGDTVSHKRIYKENSKEQEEERGATAPAPAPSGSPVDHPTAQINPTTDSSHPAILAFRDACHKFPAKDQYEIVIETIGEKPNADLLKRCWREWRKRGYKPVSIVWATDWYKNPKLMDNGKPTPRGSGNNQGGGELVQ